MIGKINKVKGQRGFSMAEVVVAVTLFVASILGVSVMLVSGGANVTRGAKDSTAANLASKKIEEVKSLSFYRPWSGANQDIDDFYWANNAGVPRPNADQLANPVVENYGSMPGYASYRRTTSVQYQYVSGSSLVPAVMNSNWVPRAPTGSQYDRPTGGTSGSDSQVMHAVMIEVKVYYQSDTGIKSYSAQGLAGDLMVTGGTNKPPLIINSIDPAYGMYGHTGVQVTAYVSTPPGSLNGSSQLSAYLWYPGCTDVYALSSPAPPRANAAGTQITMYFDLTAAQGIRAGFYNFAIYWQDEGWLAVFRDNVFEVRTPPPTLSGISNYNWGYRVQNGRRITITGADMFNATVCLKGPDPSNTYTIPGAINSNDGSTLVATFDLTGNAGIRPNDSRWNVEVTTAGGVVTSDADAKRLWMNPPPRIDSVSASYTGSSPYYFNWAWKTQTARNVRITGQYLYYMDAVPPERTCTLSWNGMETSNASFVSGPTGNNCNDTASVIMSFNPDSAIHSNPSYPHNEVHGTRWSVNLGGNYGSNASDNDGELVLMNPAPTLTGMSNFPTTATTGTATPSGGGTKSPTSSRTYTGLALSLGTYIQDDATQVYLVKGSSIDPTTNTSTVYCLLSQGVTPTIALDGTSISGLNMRVHVSPTAGNSSFMKYSGAAVNDNEIAGTYYVYFKNPDGQACPTSLTVAVTHAQYTYAVSAKQPNWATVSGGGTSYQDANVTINGTASATSNMFLAWDEWNGSAWTQVSTSNPWNLGVASTNKTYRCRYRKKLYYGDDASPNYAGFITGYTRNAWGKCDPPNYTYAEANRYTLRLHSWSSYSIFGSTLGEVACTANVDFTNATTLYIYWRQPNGNGNGVDNTAAYCQGSQNGDHNNGQLSGSTTDVFGWRWNSHNVTGWGVGWLHCNSYCDASVLGGNDTDVRIQYLYLE